MSILLSLAWHPPVLAQGKTDELKQRILSQARALTADDYSFTRTIRSEQTSGGKTEKRAIVDRFDPSKSPSDRWTLISIDGAAPSADEHDRYRKEYSKRRVPGYYRLANYFGSNATTSTDSRGRTVFHFTALPKGTLTVMDTDVSAKGVVDAYVGEANGVPFVEETRVRLTQPTRIKLIAKIDRYESSSRYTLRAEGRPVVVEQASDMAGSGMGQAGRIQTVITYSDFRPVSSKP